MKHVRMESFEKQLEASLPNDPFPVYFIFIEDDSERRCIADSIAKKIGWEVLYLDNRELLKKIHSLPLFSSRQILICDQVEEKKIPIVDDFILILTAKVIPPCYEKMAQEALILDLLDEKPWDRKRRLQRLLVEHAKQSKKILSNDGANRLLSASHRNFCTLLQELDKIIIYSGNASSLTIEMIEAISFSDPLEHQWQLSENIVLGGKVVIGNEIDFYALIGQIRYQLELGLELSQSKQSSKRAQSKQISKFQRSRLTTSYFFKGLQDLFDLELKLRSTISNQRLLFDAFIAKLATRR